MTGEPGDRFPGERLRIEEFLALDERDRDVVMAEEVFGLVVGDPRQTGDLVFYDPAHPGGHRRNGWFPLPRYTKDIAAAWAIREQVAADDGGQMIVVQNERTGLWEAYQASACADPDFGDWYELGAPTAPLAICIAALRAYGVIRPSGGQAVEESEPGVTV